MLGVGEEGALGIMVSEQLDDSSDRCDSFLVQELLAGLEMTDGGFEGTSESIERGGSTESNDTTQSDSDHTGNSPIHSLRNITLILK